MNTTTIQHPTPPSDAQLPHHAQAIVTLNTREAGLLLGYSDRLVRNNIADGALAAERVIVRGIESYRVALADVRRRRDTLASLPQQHDAVYADPTLSLQEAAALLEWHPRAVERAAKDGRLHLVHDRESGHAAPRFALEDLRTLRQRLLRTRDVHTTREGSTPRTIRTRSVRQPTSPAGKETAHLPRIGANHEINSTLDQPRNTIPNAAAAPPAGSLILSALHTIEQPEHHTDVLPAAPRPALQADPQTRLLLDQRLGLVDENRRLQREKEALIRENERLRGSLARAEERIARFEEAVARVRQATEPLR